MYILVLWCYIIFIQFATQGEWTFFHFLPSCCTIVSIVFTYSVTGKTWHINRNTCNKSMCFTTCSTSIYFLICPKFCSSIIISNSPMRHVLSIDAASPVSWALLDAFCLPQSFDQNSFSAAFCYAPVPHTHNVWLVIKSSQSLELCGRCDWTRHERPLNVIYNEHIHNVKNICMNINKYKYRHTLYN